MEVKTLADVLTLIGHLPKATRAKDTWQHDEAELKKAAAGADATQVSIALQMVPQRASNISEVPSRPTYGDLLALSKG